MGKWCSQSPVVGGLLLEDGGDLLEGLVLCLRHQVVGEDPERGQQEREGQERVVFERVLLNKFRKKYHQNRIIFFTLQKLIFQKSSEKK